MHAKAIQSEKDSVLVVEKVYDIKPVKMWKEPKEKYVLVFPISKASRVEYIGIYPESWFTPQEQLHLDI